jgi:hypothetical protein
MRSPWVQHADPNRVVQPWFWVPAAEVTKALQGKWKHRWLLGWRDICRNTDVRTVIASVLPFVAVGHTAPLVLSSAASPRVACLQANLTVLVLDYAARQKVGGTHLTFGLLQQLPILPPDGYKEPTPWSSEELLVDWILPRVLELTYTAWDLEAFARDCDYEGPPFRWDEDRRFLLRCELDAAFFHLYGLNREDTDYVLETFPVLKKRDTDRHGEYRTKRVVLEIYDALAEATRSGRPYQTRLEPPPADPRVAHAPQPLSSAPQETRRGAG